MKIVDNRASDIIAGYQHIRTAENTLQSKWRAPLLDVYAKQREIYKLETQKYQKQKLDFRHRLRLGIWLATSLLILGLLVLPGLLLINQLGEVPVLLVCFSPLLILGGLTGWAIIVVLWIWQRDQEKPVPPQNPLKTGVFYPLYPLWKEGLRGVLPGKKPDPSATGVFRFIARLQKLDLDSYLLYRIQQQSGEKVDIVVVGSKGVWVFKVKYLDGHIRWRDGTWMQIPVKQISIKSRKSDNRLLQPAFEEEWQLAANAVSNTIQEQAQGLIKEFPQIPRIRGGIVFTHPKGRYDIPPGCPFNWGVIPFWLDKFDTVPNLPGMDDFGINTVLDILLSRHQQIVQHINTRSMVAFANQIVLEAEDSLKMWVDTHYIEE
jgi:hypothetical protein